MRIKAIYYINLSHRLDRRVEIETEISKCGWKGVRIEATYVPEKGAFGCAQSHLEALDTFLSSDESVALILEDDATFSHDPNVLLEQFFADHKTDNDWDVLLLAANLKRWLEYTSYAVRVVDAQTTSAYAITRRYAYILRNHWRSCLKRFQHPELGPPEIDMSWKELMPHSKWFCLQPKPASQRPGFSDIEVKFVDYHGA